MLATRSEQTPAPPPQPVAQVDMIDVLVAKTDIGMGQTVSAQNVQWQGWPVSAANPEYIRRTDKPGAIEEIAGSFARTPFASGEPIRAAKLVNAKGSGYMAAMLSPGMRAMSVQISPETGAGGFILPNDRVDLILTRAEKSSNIEVYKSETLLTYVRILAIDQTVEEKSGQRVVVGKIATVEVSPQQAETIALAQRLGTLSLALRSFSEMDRTVSDAGSQPLAHRDSINVVRFGRSETILK